MGYKNNYRTVGRICGLLSAQECPQFLRTAAHILASLTESDRGDDVLRDAGMINPIQQLLNVDDD